MRVIPPSGVPITFFDLCAGLRGMFDGETVLERFRAEIRKYFGVKHCFLVSSGRAALSMLLAAMYRLNPGRDEVLLPAFTSFSVPSAVVNAGLKVSLYDLDFNSLGPDLKSLEENITERTLCIVVCHLYGYPCDMDAVRRIAAVRGIPVVDDAAQAMGAKYKGRKVGTLGLAGLFSLSRGKNISTVDGGIIVTDSSPLAQELARIDLPRPDVMQVIKLLMQAMMLSLLLRPWLYWIPASLPFLNLGASLFDPAFPKEAYTPFQAAIGIRMVERLDSINRGRVVKAQEISRGIAELNFVKTLPDTEPVYLRFPVICKENTLIRTELGIVRSYPLPLKDIEALKSYLVGGSEFPVAKILADSMVTVPTHQFLKTKDVEKIAISLIPSIDLP